ncbi:MAG: phage/plasmid primase, P4 family [Halanaerobiales bacterium]
MQNNCVAIVDNINENYEYAKYFLDQGLSVIPVNSVEKGGSLIKSWKKYQDEKPTIFELKKWWTEWPDAGLAIVTGKISNIIVLDIDPRHGGDETIMGKELPSTVTVNTGGGGRHYYYKYPNKLERVNNFIGGNVGLPGVDLRGDGGFIYAPPSLHHSGQVYSFEKNLAFDQQELAEVPQWLMEVIEIENQNKKNSKIGLTAVNDLSQLWSGVTEGQRNDSCARLAGKLAHLEMPIEEAKETLISWNNNNKPPLEEHEVIQTVNSIYNRHKNKFRPTSIAKKILKKEEKQGRYWEYIAEKDCFLYYENNIGKWQEQNSRYLISKIGEYLIEFNKTWDKRNKRKEVFESFKNILINEKNKEKFDIGINPDKTYINLKNGMLKWESGELIEHSHEFYSQIQFPIDYDPEAGCPTWKRVLTEWIPDKDSRLFLQEYVGYCLIPDTSQHLALILYGSGSNGKSTMLEVLTHLFGQANISAIPLHRLSDRFETANIQGKLVNICSDIDPTYMKETGILKTLIHGENIRGEYKYGASFDFRPVVRLLFSANEIPKVRDKTEGWYRSFEILTFPNKFRKTDSNYDPDLKNKLLKEISGVLNWAIEGLHRLKEKESFSESVEMRKAKKAYMAENDNVMEFLLAKTVNAPGEKIIAKELYDKYVSFCRRNNYQNAQSRKTFTRILAQEGIESKPAHIKGRSQRCYHGIKLRK